jgi:hypothetical protein
MKKGLLVLVLLAGMLYFPIPGTDPCEAVAKEERGYLMRVGLLSGFEDKLTIDSMANEVRTNMEERFGWRPAKWSCSMLYWQIRFRPEILEDSMKLEFKKQFLGGIEEQGGDTSIITDIMINRLYTEFLETYGIYK